MPNTCSTTVEIPVEHTPEKLRKIFLIKLFGIIGILVTLPFGIWSLSINQTILGQALLLISILLGINYFLISKKENYALAANIIVYIFLILFLYLVYSGGVENTGPLWIYAFPTIALFLHGLKRGLIDISLFVILLSIILLAFNNEYVMAQYQDEYKLRLLISFLLVTFLSSLYEYSNTKSFMELRILTQRLINVAKQDQLTELANRRGIHETMEHLYQDAKEKNEPLCVMLCDIDFLHDINDAYGHDIGDYVIKEVASEIQNSTKNSQTVARWSGEEFLILLPQVTLDDAHKYAKSLQKRIENLNIACGQSEIQVTLSIGISDISKVNSIYSAVRYADNQMYKIKKNRH